MKEPETERGGPLQSLPQHQARSTSRARSIAAPCPIRFTRAICGDLVQAERREWWIANGLGGYAGGTIAGSLTRRYHGLLITPIASPLGRRLILAKADATVIEGGRSWPLFTNRWKSGAISPAGHIRIGSFHLDYSVPVWTYRLGEHRIEARIWMEPGAHTTYAAWRLRPQAEPPDHELSLRVTLLANDRDHHGTTTVGAFAPKIAVEDERLLVAGAGLFSLTIRAPGGTIVPKRDWYRDFDLPMEAERGLESTDHHLCIGEVTLPLAPGQWRGIVASLEAEPSSDLEAALVRRLDHDGNVVSTATAGNAAMRDAPPWIARLALAADAFIFARPLASVPDGKAGIAGYPWFPVLGRLGCRPHDPPAGPGGGNGTAKDRPPHPCDIRELRQPGHAAQRIPRGRGARRLQHRRCLVVVFRTWGGLFRGHQRCPRAARGVPGPARHGRMASEGNTLRHCGRSRRRPAQGRGARRATDLDGCEGWRLGGHAAHRQAG